jgi:hypothetical protein
MIAGAQGQGVSLWPYFVLLRLGAGSLRVLYEDGVPGGKDCNGMGNK